MVSDAQKKFPFLYFQIFQQAIITTSTKKCLAKSPIAMEAAVVYPAHETNQFGNSSLLYDEDSLTFCTKELCFGRFPYKTKAEISCSGLI
jgi:hypothetical protein